MFKDVQSIYIVPMFHNIWASMPDLYMINVHLFVGTMVQKGGRCRLFPRALAGESFGERSLRSTSGTSAAGLTILGCSPEVFKPKDLQKGIRPMVQPWQRLEWEGGAVETSWNFSEEIPKMIRAGNPKDGRSITSSGAGFDAHGW